MTPADQVAAYIRLRDYKKKAEAEFKESMVRVKEAMDKLEGELLKHLTETGAKSLSCDDGLVYRNTVTSVTVTDPAAFKEFLSTEGWEAADIRANKTFVKEYMESHSDPIPGVKITNMYTVGVQKR